MEPIIEVKNLVKTFNSERENLGKMVALDNPEVLKENSGKFKS